MDVMQEGGNDGDGESKRHWRWVDGGGREEEAVFSSFPCPLQLTRSLLI